MGWGLVGESNYEEVPRHSFEGFLSNGKNVRVHGSHVLPTVCLDCVIVIDGKTLIRVDGHQHNACEQTARGRKSVRSEGKALKAEGNEDQG